MRDAVHVVDNLHEETIRNFHEHRQSWSDDRLDLRVGLSNFQRDSAGKAGRQGTRIFPNLIDYLFINLAWRINERTLTGLV